MHWSIFFLVSLASRCLCTPTPQRRIDLQSSGSIQSTSSEQQTTPAIATWLWESEIISDSTTVQQLLSFAQTKSVNRIFAQINPDIDATVWDSFIRQCRTYNIIVEALIGNPEWVLGNGTPSLQSQLDWINQYQTVATAYGRFTGIHMDVEPWGLDEWETKKDAYIPGWEAVAQTVASAAKSLGISFAADLPFWANTLNSTVPGQTVDIWMLNLLDYAVFMTYRNTAGGIESLAAPILAAGDATGTPVWMAMETIYLEDKNLSYFGQSASALWADLTEVAASSSSYASFGGIAVHDYNGWSALTQA